MNSKEVLHLFAQVKPGSVDQILQSRVSRRGFIVSSLGFLAGCSPSQVSRDKSKTPTPDLCTTSLMPIVFQDMKEDPVAIFKINQDLQRLPLQAVNKIIATGFRVVMVNSSETIAQRCGIGGACNDYSTKEIIMDNVENFPHEIGHAFDFSFNEQLSLTEQFIKAEAIYAQRDKAKDMEFLKSLKEQSEKQDDATKKAYSSLILDQEQRIQLSDKLQEVVELPFPQSKEAILKDGALYSYVIHLFIGGFMTYYFPEQSVGFEKEKFPELIEKIREFDVLLRKAC